MERDITLMIHIYTHTLVCSNALQNITEEMESEIVSSECQRVQSESEENSNIYVKVKPPVTLKFEDIVYEAKISKELGLFCIKEENHNSSEPTTPAEGRRSSGCSNTCHDT